jgi:hypothetical protein
MVWEIFIMTNKQPCEWVDWATFPPRGIILGNVNGGCFILLFLQQKLLTWNNKKD